MIVPKNFGFNLLPPETDKGRWCELVRCIIMDVLHKHCPQPQPLYNVTELVKDEFDFDDDTRYRVEEIIESIEEHLTPIINRHGKWGTYSVVGCRGSYLVQYLGDYRILEWEAGRGKPLPKEDEEAAFNLALEQDWGSDVGVKRKTLFKVSEPKIKTVMRVDSDAVILSVNALINGPGHTTLNPPTIWPNENPNSRIKVDWDRLIAEPNTLYETGDDICVMGHWKDLGDMLLELERGTLFEFIYDDSVKRGYLTII